jgi:hypothetical protein
VGDPKSKVDVTGVGKDLKGEKSESSAMKDVTGVKYGWALLYDMVV